VTLSLISLAGFDQPMSACPALFTYNVTSQHVNVNKFGMRSLAEAPWWAWLHTRDMT